MITPSSHSVPAMPVERKHFPPPSNGYLSHVTSSVLLRSLREYQDVLNLLEEEGRGNSELAGFIGGEIEGLQEELTRRGVEVE